jgi:hypothetical protein
VLIKRIKDYITHWNDDAKPFEWTATADEILAKVKIVQANVKKLVDNNSKQIEAHYETLVSSNAVTLMRRSARHPRDLRGQAWLA